MKQVLIALFATAMNCASAQQVISLGGGSPVAMSPGLAIGSTVPPIRFTDVMNATQSTIDLAGLKGKAVILEFWATWCGPCLPAISHLEELKKKFGDKLEVIAISDESNERIQRFIKNRPGSLIYTTDQDHNLQKHFPYHAIPHSVLIDKNGKLAAVTSPSEITEPVVDALLKGSNVTVKEKRDGESGFDFTKDYFPKPAGFNEFAFEVQPPVAGGFPITKRTQPSNPFYNRRLTMMNSPINLIYKTAFSKTTPRTVYEGVTQEEFDHRTSKQLFCIDVIVPKGKENELYTYMQKQMEGLSLEYRCRLEKRKMESVVITSEDASVLLGMKSHGEAPPVTGPMIVRATNYDKKSVPLSDLFSHCESFGISRLPIVDETGATGNYDISFAIEPEDPMSFKKALAKLGLKSEKKEREVEVLVIYKEK